MAGWLDPFLAWQTVVEPPPNDRQAIAPAYGFALAMLALSVLLNGWAIVRLRVWNPSGEPIMQREQPDDAEAEEKDRPRPTPRRARVRGVWANPILWREIRTRAYGRRPLLVKLAYFLVLGLICYFALAPLWTPGGELRFAAATGLVPVGILSLLLVSAQAVTAITSERDTGALDLLLVTDLSPQEFIFGKLGGIFWNTDGVPAAAAPARRCLRPLRSLLRDAAGLVSGAAGPAVELRGGAVRSVARAGPAGVRDGAGHARGPAASEQPAGHRQHAGHGLLPLRRHAGVHLPDPHQRPLRVPVDQLRLLPGGGHRRAVVGAERGPALGGADAGELAVPHRRLLHA